MNVTSQVMLIKSCPPASGPLHWAPDWFGGAWVVSAHDDAKWVLSSPQFSAQRTGGWIKPHESDGVRSPHERPRLQRLQRVLSRALIFLDDPDHGRVRQLLRGHFSPSALAQRTPWLEARCDALLRQAAQTAQAGDGTLEFTQTIARDLPTEVIAKVLGLDAVAAPRWHACSQELAQWLEGTRPEVQLSLKAQRAVMSLVRMVEQGAGDDGVIADLHRASDEGLLVDPLERLAQSCMLLFAGLETTRHFLGTLVWCLLDTPGAWDALLGLDEAQRRVQVRHWVREVMRLHPPVKYTGRRVAVTHEWHGQTLRRGQAIVVRLDQAGRDPARFDAPDTLSIHQHRPASLAFGAGPHVCIGAALTLLEAEVCVMRMLQAWPTLCLSSHHTAPQWLHSPLYGGLSALHLQLPA